MFPSISRALPNTSQVTQFVAPRHMTIATQSAIAFAVNSIPNANSSITVNAGDLVSATVLSSLDYLQHEFFAYTIDNIPQNFAVVTVSQFNITLDPTHAARRWYDYASSNTQLALRTANGTLIDLKLYKRFVLVDFNLHLLIDALAKSVYLINPQGGIAASFTFPDVPINYEILKNLNLALVVTAAGEVYSIDQLGTVTLLPALPTAGAICVSYDGSQYVWLAGNGWAWKLDAADNFSLLATTNITKKALDIAALPDGSAAVVATSTSDLYLVDPAGVTDLNHTGVGLGRPIYFNNKIYIPDSSNSQLLVYDYLTDTFDTPVATSGVSPSYTFVEGTRMYVCGNDSPDVLVFDQSLALVSTVQFYDKVTWISVVSGTIVVSYWLANYTLTLAPQLQRIVNVKFNKRYGPVTHIGSDVVVVKQLGAPVVVGYTANDTTLWVNGTKSSSQSVRGVDLIADDNINISYKSTFSGTSQVACVIGDTAYDYQITSFVETYIPRYIDFPIGSTVDPVYTLTITMPANMTPCTMAIEYGTLYLDGGLYDGSYYVQPASEIKISIPVGHPRNFGLGTLPIFTLGGRQFAVPISAYVNATNSLISADQLAPGTQIKKTQIISGQSALYDFILPDYYDVDILKNGISVAGGYYQVFSVGDELSVVFSSSTKLYDTVAVYILGPTNYKFVASNSPPFLIDQLPTTPIVYPYTRAIDPVLESHALITSAGSTSYVVSTNHTPVMQYQTPTYTVTTSTLSNTGSLEFVSSNNNYLHYANSFYQPYGDFSLEAWVNASQGWGAGQYFLLVLGSSTIGQLGLYFDNYNLSLFLYENQSDLTAKTPTIIKSNISLVQTIWHHVAVYRSNDVISFTLNGTVVGSITYQDPIGTGDLYISDGTQVFISNVSPTGFSGLMTDIRYVHGESAYTGAFTPTTRPLTSTQQADVNGVGSNAILSLTSTILLLGAHGDISAMADGSAFSNSEVDGNQPTFSLLSPYRVDTSVGAILTVTGGDTHLIVDGNITIGANITLLAPNGKSAVLENAVHVYLGNTIAVSRNVQSYYDGNITVIQNLLDTEGNFAEFTIVDWGITNQILKDVNYTNQGTVILDTAASPMQTVNNVIFTTKNSVDTYLPSLLQGKSTVDVGIENLLVTPASTHEWHQEINLIPPASTHEWHQEINLIPPASTHEWHQEINLIPPASTHEWDQETVMVPPASTHEWHQDTVMVPVASSHEWHQEINLVPPASSHEWHQEITLTYASSTHEWHQEINLVPLASTHEWHQETVMVPLASSHEWHQETAMVLPSSTNNWHQETAMVLPSSTNNWHQEITLLNNASPVQFISDTVFLPKSSPIDFDRDRYIIHESSPIDFDRDRYMIHESSDIGFDRDRYMIHESSDIGFDRDRYMIHESSDIGFDRDVYSLDKTAPPTKETYQISFDKLVKNKEISRYSVIKTSPPEKNILAYRLSKKQDWARFSLAKSLWFPTVKLKFTEDTSLLKPSAPTKTLENFNYPSRLSYQSFVLAKERFEPIDYTTYVLAKEQPEPMDYTTYVLAKEQPEPMDYTTYVLAKERFEPIDYTTLVLSAEKPEPMDYRSYVLAKESFELLDYVAFALSAEKAQPVDYTKFAGDKYTIIPTLYNKSSRSAEHLLLAEINREIVINYEYQPMPIVTIDYNLIRQAGVYDKTQAVVYHEIKTIIDPESNLIGVMVYADYEKSQPLTGGFIYADYEQAPADAGGVIPQDYVHDTSSISGHVTPEYQQELSIPLVSAKGVYEQELSIPLVSAKGVYEKEKSIPLVSDKGVYEAGLSLPFVSDKITYEQNLGIVWNQDIDTDATAFVNALDADAAAVVDGYMFRKPYQIFETKYYSYRVLVDTALVCKLPKGRYPIAWLLHGG